jgi:L-ascorbate metabolism protein UlaG (beta-lactamase superfamily)
MRITWHGHACFGIETARGLRVVVDPFVENGVSRRRARDVRADLQLVTHAHADHVGQALDIDAPIVAVPELARLLEARGGRIEADLNVGGAHHRDGLTIRMTPAAHSSGFNANGEPYLYGGNPVGYVIDDGETRFYHAGDTGLFGDMRHVIGDVLKPDVAALPIGDHYTMPPEHAALAARWLGVGVAIPMHYDTFPPIRQDPRRFLEALDAGIQGVVAKVDEPFEVVGRSLRGLVRERAR